MEIYEASRKAKHIVTQFNALGSKNESTVFGEVSLCKVVRNVNTALAHACPESVKVEMHLAKCGMTIYASEVQMTQMVMNLMLNAFHAMKDGGILTLRCGA